MSAGVPPYVRLANEIAAQFAHRSPTDAATAIAQAAPPARRRPSASSGCGPSGARMTSVETRLGRSIASETAKASRCSGVVKVADLLAENRDRLADFLTADAAGSKVVEYLGQLGRACVVNLHMYIYKTRLKRLTLPTPTTGKNGLSHYKANKNYKHAK